MDQLGIESRLILNGESPAIISTAYRQPLNASSYIQVLWNFKHHVLRLSSTYSSLTTTEFYGMRILASLKATLYSHGATQIRLRSLRDLPFGRQKSHLARLGWGWLDRESEDRIRGTFQPSSGSSAAALGLLESKVRIYRVRKKRGAYHLSTGPPQPCPGRWTRTGHHRPCTGSGIWPQPC